MSKLSDWRGTYLVHGLDGRTIKQAAREMKFWNIRVPNSTAAFRRNLRTVGLTVRAGRVERA